MNEFSRDLTPRYVLTITISVDESKGTRFGGDCQ